MHPSPIADMEIPDCPRLREYITPPFPFVIKVIALPHVIPTAKLRNHNFSVNDSVQIAEELFVFIICFSK
jgi:hypothetical protein